jgi:hypothetical protein
MMWKPLHIIAVVLAGWMNRFRAGITAMIPA